MSELQAKIIKKKFESINFNMNFDSAKKIQLRVKSTVQLNAPKKTDDKTALLEFKIELTSPEAAAFKIEMNGTFVFEFSEIPADYMEAAKSVCQPMATREAHKMIDQILEIMGLKPLSLNEKKPDSTKEDIEPIE